MLAEKINFTTETNQKMSVKRQALGKGLSALLENAKTDITTKYEGEKSGLASSISVLPIVNIETNPFQPRTHFEKEALLELAESIKQHGIIQPITVRKLGYDKFQLISGERRFKASQIAGLTEIPAYIRIANDQAMLEMALVENIQRENLDAVEVALSYKRLIDECDLTQEALSEKVSKKRTTITNYLRLLKLPAEIQLGIRDKKITMGHARALINIENEKSQLAIFNEIIENDLSVRQVEELAKGNKVTKTVSTVKKIAAPLSFQEQKISNDLSQTTKTKVDLKRDNKGKGKIIFHFESETELTRILDFFDL
ncbi:MAG TPA: ParB/RepB/Spo0J family partition protein [Bacteroidia bacterium]|nr:ParB/RepB/Spo0J family partition protein [Bacteroidia bacterium]